MRVFSAVIACLLVVATALLNAAQVRGDARATCRLACAIEACECVPDDIREYTYEQDPYNCIDESSGDCGTGPCMEECANIVECGGDGEACCASSTCNGDLTCSGDPLTCSVDTTPPPATHEYCELEVDQSGYDDFGEFNVKRFDIREGFPGRILNTYHGSGSDGHFVVSFSVRKIDVPLSVFGLYIGNKSERCGRSPKGFVFSDSGWERQCEVLFRKKKTFFTCKTTHTYRMLLSLRCEDESGEMVPRTFQPTQALPNECLDIIDQTFG